MAPCSSKAVVSLLLLCLLRGGFVGSSVRGASYSRQRMLPKLRAILVIMARWSLECRGAGPIDKETSRVVAHLLLKCWRSFVTRAYPYLAWRKSSSGSQADLQRADAIWSAWTPLLGHDAAAEARERLSQSPRRRQVETSFSCSPATPVHICVSLFADPLCPQKEPPTYMCALLRKSPPPAL